MVILKPEIEIKENIIILNKSKNFTLIHNNVANVRGNIKKKVIMKLMLLTQKESTSKQWVKGINP